MTDLEQARPGGSRPPRPVAVVAHTHWDREWYQPFAAFRARLVSILEELLAHLEADPSYKHFLLDGQMAVVDDYLAVRPEEQERLRRLAAAGRLSVGPWYVLMDEFCVSGETIVRNLQAGLRRAGCFGGPMPVGYLPDMFGHVAQMPQILRQAGIEHAVVWRGVPAAVERTAFWWRSPDGSTVRAEYLPAGYGNGACLPDSPDALVRRVSYLEEQLAPFLRSEEEPVLLMAGTDHEAPKATMPSLLERANVLQERFAFEQRSLAQYLASAPTHALPSWTGELRSGARANLLMGVLSNRVDVKAAAARAERALEREAEPLAALWLPPDRWPAGVLEEAWMALVRNSAHDTVCACSVDEVGRAALHRYDEARAAATAVTGEALRSAGLEMSTEGPVIINPAPLPMGGVVEIDLPGDSPPPSSQVLSVTKAGVTERVGRCADLARLLGELTADGWLTDGQATAAATGTGAGGGLLLSMEVDASSPPAPDLGSVMAEAAAIAAARPEAALRVLVARRPSLRVAVLARRVPGFGWEKWQPRELDVPPAAAGRNWLDNGLVRLDVNPADGTFSLNGLSGLDRLVDSGDAGDTYNYSPPAEDHVVARPVSVGVEPCEAGPLRASLAVVRRFVWPESVSGGRRSGSVEVEVRSRLELRAGEPLVRITTSFDNRCRDHRLRAVFPLPAHAEATTAECAFGTVSRAHRAEGGRHELGLPTFPSRRFVCASGLTFTHEGLLEHELVEDGWALAVTLLRATGVISKPAPTLRPNLAGPVLPAPAAQLQQPLTFRYAVALDAGDPYRLADLAWTPLRAVRGSGSGPLGERGTRLRVRGAVVSSLRRDADALELRVFNPAGEATEVKVKGRSGVLVDLRGEPLEHFDGSFTLGPHAIATARLEPLPDGARP